jgi:hypothetical protein
MDMDTNLQHHANQSQKISRFLTKSIMAMACVLLFVQAPAQPISGTSDGGTPAVYGFASASSGLTTGIYGRAASTGGRAILGWASSTSGMNYGVMGWSDSTSGFGVYGLAAASSGLNYGIWGETRSVSGIGLYGMASAPTGTTTGLYGRTFSTSGRALVGWASATTGTTYAVMAWADSPQGYGGYFVGARNYFSGRVGIGVIEPTVALDVNGTIRTTSFQLGSSTTPGYVLMADANGVGTWQAPPGSSSSLGGDLAGTLSNAIIIAGAVNNSKLANSAVSSAKIADGAVSGIKIADGAITLNKIADNAISSTKVADGAITLNKIADNAISTVKVIDSAITTAKIANGAVSNAKLANGAVTPAKVSGSGASTGQTLIWNGSSVVWGTPTMEGLPLPFTGNSGASGSIFQITGSGTALHGISTGTNGGTGVWGVAGATSGETYGGYFQSASPSGMGVFGVATATSGFTYGVRGESDSPDGVGIMGVVTSNAGSPYAIRGEIPSGSSGYAGFFEGRVHVNGNLSKSSGSFKIDHPLDPANKYLYHSFVESPDMMNVYNGNITTNSEGYATVILPEWFQALNKDFRYQLTVIGQFAQAIIAEEVENNRFVIRSDKPNVKVSWQVTGIRKDPYAENHRVPVEEWKPAHERGKYLYPELYGQSSISKIGK